MQKLKKDRGDTFNSILPNLLCVIVVCVFCTLFTSWMANVTNRDALNQVARKYILQMETTGYLTGEMENNLKNELYNSGMRNIVIETQTTKLNNKAEYGEDIYLVISGIMPVFEYQVNENPDGNFMELEDPNQSNPESVYWDVYIKKSSTSKAPAAVQESADKFKINLTVYGRGKITYSGKKVNSVTVERGEKPTFKFEAEPGYYISKVTLDQTVLDPSDYNLSGDKLTGQYTVNDGNGVQAYHNLTVTILAHNNIPYKINHYQMNLNGNYELYETDNLVGSTGSIVECPVKTYEGFTSPEQESITITADGTATVSYYYSRNKYYFSANDNEYVNTGGTSQNNKYYFGQTITLNAVVSYNPKEAIVLNGWTDNKGVKYSNTDTFTMPSHDVTVTPNVTTTSYTITFDPNGGTGSAVTTNAIGYFDKYQLNSPSYTKKGFALLGWSTNPNATSITYGLNDEVTKLTTGTNITLYAVWGDLGETSFKVYHFVQQVDGTYTATPQYTQTIDAYTSDIFTAEDLIYAEYDNGKTTYFSSMEEDGYEITMFLPKKDNQSEIYMFYKRVQYTLSVKTNTNGITVMDNVSTSYSNSYYTGELVTFEINVKKGYEFKDWDIVSGSANVWLDSTIENPDGSKTLQFSFRMPSTNIALEGNYILTKYGINIDLNGGNWEDNYTPYLEYDVETATFTIENPVREHYTFLGWTDLNNNGHSTDGSTVLQIAQGTTGNINLRAEWLINNYTIKINNPGSCGIVLINNEQIYFSGDYYTVSYEYNTPLTIDFTPMSMSSIFSLKLIEEVNNGTNETILVNNETFDGYSYKIDSLDHNYNFEVVFGNSNYQIIYHSNNGENKTKTQTLTFNTPFTIEGTEWTNDNYSFVGWSTSEVSRDMAAVDIMPYIKYKAGEEQNNIGTKPNDVIHLYAVWTDVTDPTVNYTVTNDMSTKQTITVTATDDGSGVKGILFAHEQINESDYLAITFTNNFTYVVDETSTTLYIYVSDVAGNIVEIGPINIYHSILEKTPGTFNYEYDLITTVDGYKIQLPTGTLKYYTFTGWSEDINGTGTMDITAKHDATLYPIYMPTDSELVNGIAFNTALKQLVNENYTYESVDETITNIKYTTTPAASGIKTVKLSTNGSDVIAYKAGNEILLYTEARDIYFVEDMSYMFYNFKGLSKIDMLSSKINTTECTNMNWMFAYAGYNNLTSLDLSTFDTSAVREMEGMFSNCGYTKLTSITFGNNFKTSNVNTMEAMFENFGYCKLTKLDVSGFDTTKVNTMRAMFAYTGYKEMTTLTLGSGFVTNVLDDTSYMFAYTGYESMTTLTLGKNFNLPAFGYMQWMFLGCGYKQMTTLDFSMFKPNAEDIAYWVENEGIFVNCGQRNNCTIYVGSEAVKQYIVNNSDTTLRNIDINKILVK